MSPPTKSVTIIIPVNFISDMVFNAIKHFRMFSIGARMLQLHFGARDELHGNLWFWIIGSGELDFKNLINLSDVNEDFRLSIKQSIDEDHQKIWFKESVSPMKIESESYSNNNPFAGIKYFNITLCITYGDLYNSLELKDVIDLNPLDGIHTLTLNRLWDVDDVSKLGNVHTLTLYECPAVDVSELGNVHTLTLASCHNVVDVSKLGSVHTLKINNVTAVDVSNLGNVHTLTLDDIENVTDVSNLGNVHALTLDDIENVTDVSALGNVHALTLNRLENVTDVSALGNVHALTLNRLENVVDVSPLGRVHALTLE